MALPDLVFLFGRRDIPPTGCLEPPSPSAAISAAISVACTPKHLCILAAAAAAKSHLSCPSLCDPIDGSPPGSAIPGILQARTLEWVAISFSSILATLREISLSTQNAKEQGAPGRRGGAGGGPDDPPDFPPHWLQPPSLQTPPSATLTSAPKLFSNCAYTGPIFQPCWVTQCSNTPTLSHLHTCIQALLRGHLGPLCLHGMRTVLPVGAPPVSSRLSIPRGEMKPFSETSLMMFIMMLCVHVLNALLSGDFLKGQDSWFYLCISRSQPNT